MWLLYQLTAQDLIAEREHELEALRIERLVSRGIDPGSSIGPGRMRRAAAGLARAISRRADDLARSLDREVAYRS